MWFWESLKEGAFLTLLFLMVMAVLVAVGAYIVKADALSFLR